MTTKPTVNLDDLLNFTDSPVHTRKVTLFSREWTIRTDINSFAAIDMSTGDAAAIMNFLRSVLVPEEWSDFSRIASGHPALSGEKGAENLFKLINTITEVAAERPTKQPATSPRSGSRRTSSPKSAASSSVVRVAR